MKVLGLAALSGILLTGCLPCIEDLLADKGGLVKPGQSQDKIVQAFGKDNGTVFLADFNGTAVNAVTGDTGKVTQAAYPKSLFGKGLQLKADGLAKPICLFENKEPLSVTLKGSMEALVRNDAPASGFNHIIDKSWLYGLSNYNGNLAVHFGGGLHGWWYTDAALPLGKWTYIAVTLDGPALKLYVNGALAQSTDYAQGSNSTAYDLGIGNASDAGFNIPFTGIIDEVRLSKVARTPAEIAKAWKGIKAKQGVK